MKNVVFKNHLNRIINSILVDHGNITYLNICESEQGHCHNMFFRDYYILMVYRRILISLINEAKEHQVQE